jgi:hypothetical protein
MYSKTNPRAGRLTTRQKRIFAVVGALVILAFGGLGAWAAVATDTYAGSGHGCVNVTVPNSTGGATLHYCGESARAFCRQAFRSADQVSLRARPQCVLAGLNPSRPSSPASPGP